VTSVCHFFHGVLRDLPGNPGPLQEVIGIGGGDAVEENRVGDRQALKGDYSKGAVGGNRGRLEHSSSRRRVAGGQPVDLRPADQCGNADPGIVHRSQCPGGVHLGNRAPSACIMTVKFSDWPVETSKTVDFQSTNPFLVTFRLYPLAGVSEGASKVPSSVGHDAAPDAHGSFERSTVLSGMPSPLASRTVPVDCRVSASDCAYTPAHRSPRAERGQVLFSMRFLNS